MAFNLLSLPTELLVRIISLSTPTDTFIWQLTARHFRNLVKDSSELQYRIAAYAAGVIDNPRSRLSHAERLERLKARETAWSTLNVRSQTAIAVDYTPAGLYDFTRGVYFQAEEGLLGTDDKPLVTDLNYVVLPHSPSAEGQPLSWSKIHSDHHIIDFGPCLQEHGLVALVVVRPGTNPGTSTVEVSLLDFATSRPHPAAVQPTLHVCTVPKVSVVSCSTSIGIVGHYLALLVTFSPQMAMCALYLYQWKTGELIRSYPLSPGSYNSLAFLADDLILLTNMAENRLEIFRIHEHPWDIAPILLLELPPVRDRNNVAIYRLTCQAEPNPIGRMSSPTSVNHADDERPFFNAPEDAIFLFSMLLISHDHAVVDKCSFVVHRRALLALVPVPVDPLVPTLEEMPWVTWGPDITRWFDIDDTPPRWITVPAGQRYALIASTASASPEPIRVLDFNPYSCWKQKQAEEAGTEDDGTRLCDETSTIMQDLHGFAEPVNSRLPYVETLTRELYRYDAVLMDEVRILGLTLGGENSDITNIDVLLMG
ncbi:hypothetical protein PLICRDRAFT_38284 [Plicaturopsis crispa FD-325 SS-3]|nr:hypothetical protein PLICRDRAFT_38284 [Plicaturopsis crispa FD-325 SS-3]